MNNKRKKILFVITKSNFGGAQRYVFDLATSLPKDEYDVAVALGGTGDKGAETGLLAQKLISKNIRVITIRSFMRDVSIIKDVFAFFELFSIFIRERPDIVHLNSSKAIVLGALVAQVLRVEKIISTVHGWAFNESRPPFEQKLITYAHKLGVFLCHHTIVVSENDRAQAFEWKKLFDRITAIHNGIEAVHLLPRAEAREKLKLPQDTLVIGSIGELTYNKNYSSLITAIALLKKKSIAEFIVSIIGDGELREELRIQSNNEVTGGIVFEGYRQHGAEYLSAFDIFVLPSLKEGLPYVLLEAGQASLPVVATDVGGIHEVIEGTATGLLVESDNPEALAKALVSYIEKPQLREEHGRALKDKVEQEFSLETMLKNTLALYK